jgi:hypothetical protein
MQLDADVNSPGPSEALQEAQARLLQLRNERGIGVKSSLLPPRETDKAPDVANWLLVNAQKELLRRWQVVGKTHPNATPAAADYPLRPEEQKDELQGPPQQTVVVIHPSIAMAILCQHLEAPARIYFLLRVIDQVGQGWLDLEDIRRQLTEKGSPLKVCGWRRLRQLLKQGEGIFWHRDSRDRLWLKGAHRIAYTLDCGRLQGFPIELPVETLLGGIQAVRAAFYAAFHGGRDARPISRETLQELTGIPGRTQLEYDRVARVERKRNMAVGERYTAESAQEQAWQRGRAAFHFVDTEGLQGRAGREYVAWHLPNSYRAGYRRRSKGSRKRLNRKLADLVKKGIPGNDDRVVEKCFFPNGALAARQYNRDPERDAYWQREEKTRAGGGLWCVIPAMKR